MTLSVGKAAIYVVEQSKPASAITLGKAAIFVVEQPAAVTGLYTKYGGAWHDVSPYVNLPVLRNTEAGNARVTEDGLPRKTEPLNNGGAWTNPLETFIKTNGLWKRVLPPYFSGGF